MAELSRSSFRRVAVGRAAHEQAHAQSDRYTGRRPRPAGTDTPGCPGLLPAERGAALSRREHRAHAPHVRGAIERARVGPAGRRVAAPLQRVGAAHSNEAAAARAEQAVPWTPRIPLVLQTVGA